MAELCAMQSTEVWGAAGRPLSAGLLRSSVTTLLDHWSSESKGPSEGLGNPREGQILRSRGLYLPAAKLHLGKKPVV